MGTSDYRKNIRLLRSKLHKAIKNGDNRGAGSEISKMMELDYFYRRGDRSTALYDKLKNYT